MKLQEFYACVNWGEPVDQVERMVDLPPEFAVSKELWDRDSIGNSDAMSKLLERYLEVLFLPLNIDFQGNYFDVQGNQSEIAARHCSIVGIDFGLGCLPKVRFEAWFDVPVLPASINKLRELDLMWSDAVSASWKVKSNDRISELDLTIGSHRGIECIPLVVPYFSND